MNNKYLEKIASIEGTIHVPKGKAEEAAKAKAKRKPIPPKKPLQATKGKDGVYRVLPGKAERITSWVKGNKGKAGLIAGGIAAASAGAYALAHKKQEKQAGILGSALGAVKSYAQGAIADASKIGEQVHSLGAAVKTNTGIGAAAGNLAKNKAVQTGAGLVGAGAVGGYAAGQSKQSSEKRDRDGKEWAEASRENDKRGNKAFLTGLKGGVIGAGLGFGAGAIARKLHLGHLAGKKVNTPPYMHDINSALNVNHKTIGGLIGGVSGTLTGSTIGSIDATQDLIHKERKKHTKTASDNKYLEKIAKN